jgi:hypothetical protein
MEKVSVKNSQLKDALYKARETLKAEIDNKGIKNTIDNIE